MDAGHHDSFMCCWEENPGLCTCQAGIQQSYTPSPRRLLFIVFFIVSQYCSVNSRRVAWQLRTDMSFKFFLLVGLVVDEFFPDLANPRFIPLVRKATYLSFKQGLCLSH